jgi:hypothetical protein
LMPFLSFVEIRKLAILFWGWHIPGPPIAFLRLMQPYFSTFSPSPPRYCLIHHPKIVQLFKALDNRRLKWGARMWLTFSPLFTFPGYFAL